LAAGKGVGMVVAWPTSAWRCCAQPRMRAFGLRPRRIGDRIGTDLPDGGRSRRHFGDRCFWLEGCRQGPARTPERHTVDDHVGVWSRGEDVAVLKAFQGGCSGLPSKKRLPGNGLESAGRTDLDAGRAIWADPDLSQGEFRLCLGRPEHRAEGCSRETRARAALSLTPRGRTLRLPRRPVWALPSSEWPGSWG